MESRILVADDEERIRSLIRDFLEIGGYEVLEAADGEEALDIFYREKNLSLVILDVMMPKMDGLEVCKEIRENSSIPVLMLTALGQERDELKGFQCGADEYIAKPFSPKILIARVQALLRRTESMEKDLLTIGDITLDVTAHKVMVCGEAIELSMKEFDLLHYLMQNKGVALSRDKILNSVWDFDYFGDDRTIDTHIKKLRSKLGKCGNYIVTVWGIGYKFEV